jgi:hypothetical protein
MREATRAGNSTADAAALIISDEILDKLVNRDTDDKELDLDVLSKIIKRMRDSDRGAQALAHKIEQDQFDASQAAIKHAKEIQGIVSDKSIDETEKINRVRLRLFGAAPADFKPVGVRSAG